MEKSTLADLPYDIVDDEIRQWLSPIDRIRFMCCCKFLSTRDSVIIPEAWRENWWQLFDYSFDKLSLSTVLESDLTILRLAGAGDNCLIFEGCYGKTGCNFNYYLTHVVETIIDNGTPVEISLVMTGCYAHDTMIRGSTFRSLRNAIFDVCRTLRPL
jgi:hypothetical protein